MESCEKYTPFIGIALGGYDGEEKSIVLLPEVCRRVQSSAGKGNPRGEVHDLHEPGGDGKVCTGGGDRPGGDDLPAGRFQKDAQARMDSGVGSGSRESNPKRET